MPNLLPRFTNCRRDSVRLLQKMIRIDSRLYIFPAPGSRFYVCMYASRSLHQSVQESTSAKNESVTPFSREFARFIVETKDRNLKAQQRTVRDHGRKRFINNVTFVFRNNKSITMKIAILAALVS